MFKLTAIVIVLAATGVLWLRTKWGRSKNKNAARQIINDLKSGKYVIESYADAMSIMICTKSLSRQLDFHQVKQVLNSMNGKRITPKLNVSYADFNDKMHGIVIAEGVVKDYIHDSQVDIHYPCWLYIIADEEQKTVTFKSTFPENKDHHYLLEDLSEEIIKHSMK